MLEFLKGKVVLCESRKVLIYMIEPALQQHVCHAVICTYVCFAAPADDVSHVIPQEDWGEPNGGKRPLALIVLNTQSKADRC